MESFSYDLVWIQRKISWCNYQLNDRNNILVLYVRNNKDGTGLEHNRFLILITAPMLLTIGRNFTLFKWFMKHLKSSVRTSYEKILWDTSIEIYHKHSIPLSKELINYINLSYEWLAELYISYICLNSTYKVLFVCVVGSNSSWVSNLNDFEK